MTAWSQKFFTLLKKIRLKEGDFVADWLNFILF